MRKSISNSAESASVFSAAAPRRGAISTALAALLLSACGGGSGETAADAAVQGRAVKGVIGDARIDVFPSNPLGQPAFSTPDESTNTAPDGSFSLTPVSVPSLVMSSGGSFVDEADQDSEGDGRRQIQLGPGDAFESILFPGETDVAITPYTQLLIDKARREVSSDNFLQTIEKNRQIAISALGFDPFTTTPADPIAPGEASLPQRRYALLLGGIANAINRVSIALGFSEPRFEIIQAVIRDLSDGSMDGLENGNPVMFFVDSQELTLPTDIRINEEVNRFANNNFDAYGGLRGQIDENVLSSSGANEAPRSTGSAQFSLQAGGNRTLNLGDFAVTDPDAGPQELRFIMVELPVQADIDVSGTELDPGDSFTLADLQAGRVNYSDNSSGDGSDSFIVSASDGAAGLSIAVTVTLGAAAVNNPPEITGSLSFTVEELGSFTLTPSEFAATDPDTGPASALPVTLSEPPARGELLRDGIALETGGAFTIGDIQNGLISYRETSGQGSGSDNFTLAVSDGELSTSASVGVTITASASNNIAPSANGSFSVELGHSKILTPADFDVTDPDSPAAERSYRADGNAPAGKLRLNGIDLEDGDSFTETDLIAGRVSYKHDGTPGATGFQVIIDDGSGTETATTNAGIPVTINALDVNNAEYHSLFSYPFFGLFFGSEGGPDTGAYEFAVERSDIRIDSGTTGPTLILGGDIRDSVLRLQTTNSINYSAQFDDLTRMGDTSSVPINVNAFGEFQALLPTEREFLNSSGFDELVQARSIRFVPADLETGIAVATLQHTFEEFSTAELDNNGGSEELDVTNPTAIFTEQNLFLLTEKSTDASAATFNGSYGVVEFGLSVEDGPAGETEIFNFLVDLTADGVNGEINGSEVRSDVNRRPGRETLLEEQTSAPETIGPESYAVTSEGILSIGSEGTATGFISPDGSFVALAFRELEDGAQNNVSRANVSQAFGVRRDPAPDFTEFTNFRLQGYQVCYQQSGETQVDRFVRNQLSFSAGGASLDGLQSRLIRDSDASGFGFLPTFISNSVTLTSNVGSNGLITLSGTSASRNVQLEGYLADTGRLLVLNTQTRDTTNGEFCRGIALAVPDVGFDLDNSPPVAVITGTPTAPIAGGETVTLNATASTDADGDDLNFSWFTTAGTLSATSGASVTFTAPADGTSAVRVYLSASDGDFQNVTFASIVYQDPDPRLTRNQTTDVEQGHNTAIDGQALQTTDADTPTSNLVYTVDNDPKNGRLLLNGLALGIGGTFTQADIDSGNLSYEQTGQALTADNFAFTVSDGNASDSGTFNLNVTPFNANLALHNLNFFTGFERNFEVSIGNLEVESSAVFERDVVAAGGSQLNVQSRFTSLQTDAELSTANAVNYVLSVDQQADPDDIVNSVALLLPSGQFRELLDRVVLDIDAVDNRGEAFFPTAANFIPLDLKNGVYVAGFTEFADEFRLMDSTGDGNDDALDVNDPLESDGGVFFDVLAEQAVSANLATLSGNYRTVGFEFAFDDPAGGRVNFLNVLSELVFDGNGNVSGGGIFRELERTPGGAPEVVRNSGDEPNAFDGSSYTVSANGQITFTDPNPATFGGFTTADGSFYALQLAQIDGEVTNPSSVDQFIELGVKVNTAAPDLADRRFIGELVRFCYGSEGNSRIERDQQLEIQFSADGSEVTIDSLTRTLNRSSDEFGVDFDSENRRSESLEVTTASNGGFSATLDNSGDFLIVDGALSANGRVLILRYGLDGTISSSENCEGYGIAGADVGQEVLNERPTISVQSDSSTVSKGQTAQLTATATDQDGTTPTIRWVATAGTLSPDTGTNVTWTAPPAAAPDGIARIYATATDGNLPITSSVDIFYLQ